MVLIFCLSRRCTSNLINKIISHSDKCYKEVGVVVAMKRNFIGRRQHLSRDLDDEKEPGWKACGLDVPGRTALADVQHLGCQLEEGNIAMVKTKAGREVCGYGGVCAILKQRRSH